MLNLYVKKLKTNLLIRKFNKAWQNPQQMSMHHSLVKVHLVHTSTQELHSSHQDSPSANSTTESILGDIFGATLISQDKS